MIVFDLCCAAGDHRFEAWFASSDGFADQQARGLIACPVCGDSAVKKAAMAPRVGAKSNQAAIAPVSKTTDPEPGPELVRKLLAGIAAKQRSEEHTSELQSLMRISYAVFCLQKKEHTQNTNHIAA